MQQKSLGLIEAKGLLAGIEAADAAVKSANVNLVGYEFAKGGGWTTIKVEGDVGAVKAAVDAARIAAEKVTGVVSTRVIARPSDGLELFIRNKDTVGYEAPKAPQPDPEPTPDPEPQSVAVIEETPEVVEAPAVEETSEAEEATEEEVPQAEAVQEIEEIPVVEEVAVDEEPAPEETSSEEAPKAPQKRGNRRNQKRREPPQQ